MSADCDHLYEYTCSTSTVGRCPRQEYHPWLEQDNLHTDEPSLEGEGQLYDGPNHPMWWQGQPLSPFSPKLTSKTLDLRPIFEYNAYSQQGQL